MPIMDGFEACLRIYSYKVGDSQDLCQDKLVEISNLRKGQRQLDNDSSDEVFWDSKVLIYVLSQDYCPEVSRRISFYPFTKIFRTITPKDIEEII